MSNREQFEKDILDSGIVAIIRGFPPDTCMRLAEAYAKGGIRAVEVTFVQKDRSLWKNTTVAISAIAHQFAGALHVGAGTVLTAEQLSMTQDAGGEFMVSPNANPDLIRDCISRGMAAVPGALTPTEIVSAWDAGASFVKVFPAGSMGPAYVKALRAPLSHVRMLAVGGITPDNVGEFVRAGCCGAAVSGALTRKDWIDAGEWDRITEVALQLTERVKG